MSHIEVTCWKCGTWIAYYAEPDTDDKDVIEVQEICVKCNKDTKHVISV